MAGDGKMDSNRMALADNEEYKSKTNSALGLHSMQHSANDNSKFDDPPQSPVFEGNKIFQQSPTDKEDKLHKISIMTAAPPSI